MTDLLRLLPSSPGRRGPAPPTPDLPRPESHGLGRWYEKWIGDWWLGELLAAFLACSVTIAYCALLAANANRPATTYLQLLSANITLSAVVAILITVSAAAASVVIEACLTQLKWHAYADKGRPLSEVDVHDDAARGAVGSLKLIWKLRGRPLATFGAVLKITILFIPPLAQQAVQVGSQSRPSTSGQATTPSVFQYSFGGEQEVTNQEITPIDTTLSTGFQGAVIAGLFAPLPGMVNETGPQCTTGNCTFPDYASLAICSDAVDISDHIKPNDTQWCLPNGQCIISTTSEVFAQVGTMAPPGEMPNGNDLFNYSSVAFTNRKSTIADMYVMYHNITSFATNAVNASVTYKAVEFKFEWCVPTFSTSVTNGAAVTTRNIQPIPDFDMEVIHRDMESTLGVNITEQLLKVSVNNTVYTVNAATHIALQTWMPYLLSGNVTLVANIMDTESQGAAAVFGPFIDANEDQPSIDGSDYSSLDKAMPSFQSILNNSAISMTNHVRGFGNLTNVAGKVYNEESVYQISWGYIAAPILHAFGSLIFLLITMAQRHFGSQPPPPVWKTSSGPTLRVLDPVLVRSMGEPSSISAMQRVANAVRVRLLPQGPGWQLVSDVSAAHRNESPGMKTERGYRPVSLSSEAPQDPQRLQTP